MSTFPALHIRTNLAHSLPRSRLLSSTPHRLASAPPPPRPTPAPQRGSPQGAYHSAYTRARGEHYARRNRSLALYSVSTIILVTATTYLAVPLYRVFCSATGYGGTPMTDSGDGTGRFSASRLVPAAEEGRRIRVSFNADSSDSLPWSFEPQQREVRVLPGETSLAFYRATNHSSEDIIGIATYNVTPNNVSLSRQAVGDRGQLRTTADRVWCVVVDRSHRTLPRWNASALRSSGCSRGRRSTCRSSSSSTATSWRTRS